MGVYLYRAVDSDGDTLAFLLSPTPNAEAAKRYLMKALHSTAGSVPSARPLQEQGTQREALTVPTTTKSAPCVLNDEKNAAYHKAMAELTAAGVLAASVELTSASNASAPWWMLRSSLYQTLGQACDGLLFRGNCGENPAQVGGEAQASQGTGGRGVGKGDFTEQTSFIARLFGMVA